MSPLAQACIALVVAGLVELAIWCGGVAVWRRWQRRRT